MLNKKQNSNILNMLNYSLSVLDSYRKQLLAIDNKNLKQMQVIGGIIILLTANLIRISEEVIRESLKTESANAKDDLLKIKNEFNQIIDKMINAHQDNKE